MSSTNGKADLSRYYDWLTPAERFRLDVEAMARGDEEDSRRLADSCPRRNYTATDYGFSERWQTALELVMAVSLDLAQHTARLAMIDAWREAHSYVRTVFVDEAHRAYMDGHERGSRYVWEQAGMNGDPPMFHLEELEDGSIIEHDEDEDPRVEEDLDKLTSRLTEVDIAPELLRRLERDVATKALVIWEGYTRFCEQELALGAEKLLSAAFEPALEGVEKIKALAEEHGLTAEEEKVSEYLRVLSESWERRRREFERLSG